MGRYVKRPRAEPTSEEFLALLILIGPIAFIVRLLWRWTTAARAERDSGTRT
jgi:hypothetical protein